MMQVYSYVIPHVLNMYKNSYIDVAKPGPTKARRPNQQSAGPGYEGKIMYIDKIWQFCGLYVFTLDVLKE